MIKKGFLPFFVLLLLAGCNQTEKKNSLTSSLSSSTPKISSSSSSNSELVTNIRDFEFVENEDHTLSIQKYNNFLPKRVCLPDEYLGKPITGILSGAFASSGGIETIVISKNIKNIASDAFISCLTITNFEADTENAFFQAENGLLYNKEKDALLFCPTKREGIEVASTITKIGDGAFQYYRGTSIQLNEGLLEIGASAFANTAFLETITIPNSVQLIKENAFYLSGIRSIKLGTGMNRLTSQTFMNCTNLTELTIPGTIKTIENSAIRNNLKLKTLTFNEGVETIANGACPDNAVQTLNLPTSLRTIGDNAFIRNRSLLTVDIPEGVIHIGNGAFSYCEQLTELSISSTIQTIGYSIAAYDRNLKTIQVDSQNQYFISLDNVLYSIDCTRLLVFPAYHSAFEYVVNSNVTSIDREAFTYLLRLTKVVLPASIQFIGAYAFRMSNTLTTLEYLGNQNQFKNITYKETIDEIDITCFEASYISSIHCQDGDLNVNEL